MAGREVLDLGCGFGDFCRFAIHQGAVSVQGVDISRRMIEEAERRTRETGINYVHQAIEDFVIRPLSYDVVVSRLAIHYVKGYEALIRAVFSGLREGGDFIFSVEHPICTALCGGWHENKNGEAEFWPVDNYSNEGERHQRWFVDGVLKYHRTLQTYVNCLLDAGFVLTRLLEPSALPEYREKRPDLRSTLRRPPLLIIAAHKQEI